jgi:hypothetical protein
MIWSYERRVGWIWFDYSINGVSTARVPIGYYCVLKFCLLDSLFLDLY